MKGPVSTSAVGDRLCAVPGERGRCPTTIAGGESDALVLGVGEDVDDPPLAGVQIDLNGVCGRVAIEARGVPAVGGRVIESLLGERKDWQSNDTELRQQRDSEKIHKVLVSAA